MSVVCIDILDDRQSTHKQTFWIGLFNVQVVQARVQR